MKNTKFLGIAAFVAVIVFSMIACEDPTTPPKNRNLSGTVIISPSENVTTGTELTATYNGTETVALSWQWKKDGSNVGINADKFTPVEAGKYTVTVSAKGYAPKTSPAVTVTGETLATLSGDVSISPSTDVSVNTELTASYSGTEEVTLIYQWKKGDSNVGTNADKFTPTEAGTYTVTVSAAGYAPKTSAPVTVSSGSGEPAVTLTGISAKYTPDPENPIFPDTDKHTLKDYLIVTAAYSDDSTKTLGMDDYELSGELTEGESTITVTYQGKTTTFKVTVHAAHDHNWSQWTTDKQPTCTEAGEERRDCTADPAHPHHETRAGAAALGHDTGDWVIIQPPTCTETGTRELQCTRDHAVLTPTETTVLAALGHTWGEWETNTVNDPVTDNSFRTRTCGRDSSHIETEMTVYATGSANLAFALINNDAEYRVSRGTATGAIVIPAYYRPPASTDFADYKPVTTISNGTDSYTSHAFGFTTANTTITSITFTEDSRLTTINDYAFRNNTNAGFTAITLPDSVTTIGASAFNDCSSLTSVTIPDSVTTIENQVFRDCTSLTSITIPASVTTIGSIAFQNCTSLTSITIPENVTYIGTNPFTGCTNLTNIVIDTDKVTLSGTTWGSIFPATGLNVTFKKNVGDNAFNYTAANSTKLASVTIADGVTSIGTSAFLNNTGLTAIPIPASVTTIGASAFSGCTGLTSVTLPASLTSIGNSAFRDCTSLTAITIPASVTTIGTSAFQGCTSLTSVTFAANSQLTTIGESAFYGLTGLTGSLTIPASVTTIGTSAFRGCTGLTSVNIPAGSIGMSAFNGCSGLTSVTLGAGITLFEQDAFSYCTSLTSITIPAGSIGTAFRGCTNLTTVAIGAGVTTIGSNVFYQCPNLATVTIAEGVTTIASAFEGCTGLATIAIPASVTSISGTFIDCTNLETVTFAANSQLTTIDNNTFQNCAKLASIIIPNSVTTIGTNAFNGCTLLASVTLPASVTSIGNQAFRDCTSLAAITIPANVTLVEGAFFNCTGLNTVIFAGTIPTASFSSTATRVFPGDLRDKFYATDTANGTPGIYTRESGGSTWTKQ